MRRILCPVIMMIAFSVLGTTYGKPAKAANAAAPAPTATISATDTEICIGESVEATIVCTGDGPWEVVINDKDGEYLKLKKIESPYTLILTPEEDNLYYLASVKDKKKKKGDTFGEVEVIVGDPTPVSIQLEKSAYLASDPGVNLVSTPSGGVFSGNGVEGGVFYPSRATPAGSPHNITCTFTNQYGCVSYDDIDIHVLFGEGEVNLFSGDDIISTLCDDGETYVIRGSNLDKIPGTFELREAGSQNPVPDHISDLNLKDDMAILDPAGLTGGSYDIIYAYEFQGLTVTETNRFQVYDFGTIEIPGLPDAVCKSDDPYSLIPELSDPDPAGVYQFNGPGVSGSQEEGYFYDPGDPDAPAGLNQITLEYHFSNGCRYTLTRVVTNGNAPDVQFSLDPLCLSEDGGIVDFENLTEGKDLVESWSWDFGDPSSGANNFSSQENPSHFYAETGARQITLTAITAEGCTAHQTVDTILTNRPMADFIWINDCFIEGQKIAFVDRSISDFASLDTFIWTFRSIDGGVLDVVGRGSSADTVEFSFSNFGSYMVDLQVSSEVGCVGEVTKEIILNPIMKLTSEGYEENFNGENTDWISGSDEGQSWIRNEPDFTGFNQLQDDWAWFTNLPPDNSGYLEHSWIQSGCFDFTDMKNPYIQIDLLKSFAPLTDGAVLQYQDVVSEGWKTIGNVGTGINWYNMKGLLNKPGESSTGWGLNIFNPDTEWVNAGHNLDMVAGLSHVKFRVAVATGGSKEIESGNYNQGFAFDNVFIGERFRKSLLEHFTNSSIMEGSTADDVVDHLATNNRGSVIDLQYHMDHPGVDPMNVNNPSPPSTRAFNYGLQGVPFAVLNGGSRPDHQFDFSDPSNEPSADLIQQVSLEAPVFDVELDVNWMENGLEANTLITCKVDTFQSNLQLYVVLMETLVTAYPGLNGDTVFRNVVLDILPLPTGALLGNDWYSGKTDTRTFSWDYTDYVEDIEDLAVVAFVQDRDNWQVLQVATNYLTPQVGKPVRRNEARSIAIYPNPAKDQLYVNLGSGQEYNGEIKIMDLSGKMVLTVDVQPGISLYRLDVDHLSRGMYMIYLTEAGKLKGRKKVAIIR